METGKTRIRHQVFTEVARMAYEGGDLARTLEELPYRKYPARSPPTGTASFEERAVVGERLRLALGMPHAELFGVFQALRGHSGKRASGKIL
jgi:hypothetical protein